MDSVCDIIRTANTQSFIELNIPTEQFDMPNRYY